MQLDVKSRWSSTHYMLESFIEFRPIIDILFKNVRKLSLSKKQTNNLLALQISNTSWDLLEQLKKVLEPFRNAVKLISGSQYPTVGLTLFVLRKLQQNFLEIIQPDDDDIILKIKELLYEKFIYYTSANEYGEGFKTLLTCAYFDPYGLSVLTPREVGSIERFLKNSPRQLIGQQQQFEKVPLNKKMSTLDKFLDSIDSNSKDNHADYSRSTPLSLDITNEMKKYKRLASNFMANADAESDKSVLLFWKKIGKAYQIYLFL
ncbi:unnamed protein product [Rotaria sp. Silwood2]|nr:unnamed protein product [Rotaria sp. Silwood2]CAF4380070.1 unnamed protein product [Rotaria sp. Silwood2]CAF4634947.1 unnamed protein product [Rotaria sp. Silwood2]